MKQPFNRPEGRPRSDNAGPTLDTSRIRLDGDRLPANLLDEVAEYCAQLVGEEGRESRRNKPSQLRGFYDEVVMWSERVRREPARYDDHLPLIRMLVAKVAYAHGRELVTKSFEQMIRACVKQLAEGNPETFLRFKLFFEAFMGFYRVHGPRG